MGSSAIFVCLPLAVVPDLYVVFFKPKTAYEVRSSDWSSDVCSSDLIVVRLAVLIAMKILKLRDVGVPALEHLCIQHGCNRDHRRRFKRERTGVQLGRESCRESV